MAKNTAALVFLRVVMPLVSVAVVLAVSRVLGSEGLGRYTLAFTFLLFFNTVAPLGLYTIITRDGARDPAALEAVLANALTLGTAASLVLAVVMAGLGAGLRYDAATRAAVVILSLGILPFTLGTLFEGAFAALERMEYIAAAAVIETVVKVGGGVGLLLAGFGLDTVLLLAVVGRALACAGSVALLRRAGVRVRWGRDGALLRSLAAAAPTFLFSSIFATLYWRIDVFMLSQFRPVADVGYYGAAWRLLELGIVVPQSFCLALYPQMASLARVDRARLGQLGRSAVRYLVAASLPAAACTTAIAGPIMALLYGEPFRVAGATLSVLMWTVIPYGWVRYHAYVLVALDRQGVDLGLNLIMTLVNVGLNLWLIPAYSYLGAAVATLVSVVVYGLAQLGYLRWRLPGQAVPLALRPAPLLAAAVATAAAWAFHDHPLAAVGLAGTLYVAVLVTTGFFTEAELRLLRLDRVLASVGLAPKVP